VVWDSVIYMLKLDTRYCNFST